MVVSELDVIAENVEPKKKTWNKALDNEYLTYIIHTKF